MRMSGTEFNRKPSLRITGTFAVFASFLLEVEKTQVDPAAAI